MSQIREQAFADFSALDVAFRPNSEVHVGLKRLDYRSVRLRLMGIAASALVSACAASAQPARVVIDAQAVFPVSIDATRAGDLFVGNTQTGGIYRASHGANIATLWIDPRVSGMKGVLGIHVDDRHRILYACAQVLGAAAGGDAPPPALRSFDLATGAAKGAYLIPDGAKSLCNEIATAPDGTAYVADTNGGRVLRLQPGAAALEEWAKAPGLAGADGLVVAGDGNVYINTVTTGKFFRITVGQDGSAAAVIELEVSSPLQRPDGMRLISGMRFIQAEATGNRVAEIEIVGDRVMVRPLGGPVAGPTSVAYARGVVWSVSPKFEYLSDPALKDKSPEPFTIDRVAALPE